MEVAKLRNLNKEWFKNLSIVLLALLTMSIKLPYETCLIVKKKSVGMIKKILQFFKKQAKRCSRLLLKLRIVVRPFCNRLVVTTKRFFMRILRCLRTLVRCIIKILRLLRANATQNVPRVLNFLSKRWFKLCVV